jgi:cell division protein FtsW
MSFNGATTASRAPLGSGARSSSAQAASRRKREAPPANILAPRLLFIISTTVLVVFGLIMVYSASFVEGFTNPNIQDGSYIFRHQLLLAGAGVLALGATMAIDYRVWNSPLSWLPWAIVVVLLALTWAMGNEELGGRRWFDLFGYNLQPSEFAKVAMLLVAGMLVVRLHKGGEMTPLLFMIAAAIGLPVAFILLQPDLGTTLIALAGIVADAWFGELSMKPVAAFGLIVLLIGLGAIFLAGFRMARIDAWLDPWAYASDSGYQIVNSFYALADGGVTGVGLGMSHQKYLYLPQPHNDLIFPIIGEELGLIGAVVVVLLFLVFLLSAFLIARNAPDLYGRVVAGSAAAMIGFQAFLNMLCMVNLLPMTGKPLPFFSAGGSSLVVTLILVGLILNVSLRSSSSAAADQRRDQLLIIEGGRPGPSIGWPVLFGGGQRQQPVQGKGGDKNRAQARPPGSSRGRAPVGAQAQSQTRFRRQPTQAYGSSAAKAAKGAQGAQKGQLRRPPARKAASAAPGRSNAAARNAAPTRKPPPGAPGRNPTRSSTPSHQPAGQAPRRSAVNPALSLSPARNPKRPARAPAPASPKASRR